MDQELLEKARKIRAIIFDVDGVLTDGGIIYTNSGEEVKRFHVRDGLIIRPLRELGFVVGAITGRNSPVVEFRMKELKVDFLYQGSKNKLAQIHEIATKYSIELSEIAYIGDDVIDMNSLEAVGLGFAPAEAPDYVKKVADIVTDRKGGEGVLREAAEFILEAQDKMQNVIESYTARK